MFLRKAKGGRFIGQYFWVCCSYPKEKHIFKYKESTTFDKKTGIIRKKKIENYCNPKNACPLCHGSGKARIFSGGVFKGKPNTKDVMCMTCLGTGKRRKIQETNDY